MKIVTPKDLTLDECLDWLVKYDPEAAQFWEQYHEVTELRGAVEDNLRDFGEQLLDDGRMLVAEAHIGHWRDPKTGENLGNFPA